MLLNFIKNLKIVEAELLSNSKIYHSAKEKYLHGECETLVYFLYLINNKQGSMIELKKKDEFTSQNVFHYVFFFNDKYYDINGEFNSLISLIKKTKLFGSANGVLQKDIDITDSFGLENHKVFKKVKSLI